MTTTHVAEAATAHVADVIATAYRVTTTQAMVAFQRGETVLVAEANLPTVPVTASTTTHTSKTTTWGELSDAVLDDLAVGRDRTFYIVLAERDDEGNPWPLAYTVNRERVVPGMRVRDYDYRETTVTARKPSVDGYAGTVWFRTANGGLFDGSRLFAL